MVLSNCARLTILSACAFSVDAASESRTQMSAVHSAQLKLMEAMATSAVKTGKEIDETIKTELKELLGKEIANAKTQIVTGHKADKQELQDIKSNYDTLCKNKFTTRQSELDGIVSGAVAAKEQTHKTCRTVTLKDDDDDQTRECNEILTINSNIRNAASAISAPAGREGWEPFWQSVKALLNYETSQVSGEEECVKAEGIRVQTVKDCNKDQRDYEDAFCLQRERKDASCSAYDSCYDEELANLQAAIDQTSLGQASRKAEWEAIHKIECFIQVILGEGGLTTDQAGLDTCKAKTWDDMKVPADGDDLTLPDVSLGAQLPCDMSSVATHPCVDGFTDRYKNADGTDFLEMADCYACNLLVSELPDAQTFTDETGKWTKVYQIAGAGSMAFNTGAVGNPNEAGITHNAKFSDDIINAFAKPLDGYTHVYMMNAVNPGGPYKGKKVWHKGFVRTNQPYVDNKNSFNVGPDATVDLSHKYSAANKWRNIHVRSTTGNAWIDFNYGAPYRLLEDYGDDQCARYFIGHDQGENTDCWGWNNGPNPKIGHRCVRGNGRPGCMNGAPVDPLGLLANNDYPVLRDYELWVYAGPADQ